MHVYLEFLGCRLNAAEVEDMARRFAGAGWTVVESPLQADVIVFNSCAVTAQAARKSRHRLRTLHHRNPDARFAVTGCWATEDVARARQLPGVFWVIPNADKAQVVETVTGVVADPADWEPGRWGHTRAFLAVQDGCDHTCTYCVTRLLRGIARSCSLQDAVNAVEHLVDHGAQEVVLTGVSLGAYGHDLGMSQGLAALSEVILNRTMLPRLRLSSVEPWDVDDRLLRLLENPRFCRQLHLPLQSGSETVLRRMGRRSTAAQFAELVAAARAISPDVAITTDVIVGFPGETDAEFAEGLAFVERIGFARLHVFPYSERTGTPAVRLPGRVPEHVRVQRAAQMRTLGESSAMAYRAGFLGQTLPVLWENRDAQGYWCGWTDNYLAVKTLSAESLGNCIRQTCLTTANAEFFLGEVEAPAVNFEDESS
ncbi:MAG: tRNA (N(6)-L-threonylcarbamoyladenosine(37)-C(2))-methylthiotransferase MtaB [Anaerolineae bacterium]|nr:tRNA (N(6)-L-threonylcarbamoyladenosine(37)-C(2))-methylthiotransferase MtaB [Anaerolineae bacterium]